VGVAALAPSPDAPSSVITPASELSRNVITPASETRSSMIAPAPHSASAGPRSTPAPHSASAGPRSTPAPTDATTVLSERATTELLTPTDTTTELPAPAPVGQPRHSLQNGPRSLFWTWLAAFCAIFSAGAVWSFASPLGSGPDEPAHLDRAASLVRGQLLGTPLAHPTNFQKGTVTVRVPEVFAALANDIGCFQFKSAVPAGCRKPLPASAKEVATQTYVGRYPPLYYLLVGLPTLFLVSVKGIYAARLVSVALSAVMLALAVTSLRRCRGTPLAAAGLSLAVTPMALYLAAIINPNGLEVASAASAWTSAVALASLPPEDHGAATIGALGGSLAVLLLTRPLSPLWAFGVLGALVTMKRPWSWREMLRRRPAWAWSGACVVAASAAGAWDLFANPFLTEPGSPVPAHASESQIVVIAFERLDLLVSSSIGFFGWLDTPSPEAVIIAWLAVLGLLAFLAAALGKGRGVFVMATMLAIWALLPVAIAIEQARTEGILGQGRDYLGLAMGIPLVAAAIAGEPFAERARSLRLVSIVVTVLAVAQVADFYGALRRNTVGTNGPLDALAHVAGGWSPPVPGAVLVSVFALATATFALLLRRAAGAQRRSHVIEGSSPASRLGPAR
jgi:hypothetical protein